MDQKQSDMNATTLRDEKPLQSWKEIGTYLDRDMRTAIRWEKEEGLPIRRRVLQQGRPQQCQSGPRA